MIYDLIMVPDGSVNRKIKGAELFKAGVAKNIFATYGPGNSPLTVSNYYSINGIAGDHALYLDQMSMSTWDDGDQTREIMNRYFFKSVLVVVSTYEWVRCNIIFRKDLWGKKVGFVTVNDPFGISRIFSEIGGSLRAVVTK